LLFLPKIIVFFKLLNFGMIVTVVVVLVSLSVSFTILARAGDLRVP